MLRTQRRWHERLVAAIAASWRAWRHHAAHRVVVHQLEDLNERLLRDIGIDEPLPPRRLPPLETFWFR